MKKKTFLLTFLMMLVMSLGFGIKDAKASIPNKPNAYYYDEINLLDDKTKNLVETTSENYQDTKKQPQVVMAAIKSTDSDSIDSYAPDMFEKWGIGNADEDNGVLILYALNNGERNVRIEVGYGLEGGLTDAQTGEILQKYKNDLKSNDKTRINNALRHVFNAVTTLVDKEYGYKVTKEKNREKVEDNGIDGKYAFWIFAGIIILTLFGGFGGGSGPGGRRRRRQGMFYGGYFGGGFGSSGGSSSGSSGGGFGGFGGGSSGGGGSSI